jgi:hypothetical protein
MNATIGICDLNDARAKAFARRFILECKDVAAVVLLGPHGKQVFRCEANEIDDAWAGAPTGASVLHCVLVHGNDCALFDNKYRALAARAIWYGGHVGAWDEYHALKARGVACEKIYTAIGDARIPLSTRDLWEIVRYATQMVGSNRPSCLDPPPDSGLLMALSICIQSEILQRKNEMFKWLAEERVAKGHVPQVVEELAASIRQFDCSPDCEADWKRLFDNDAASLDRWKAEVRDVGRALQLDDEWSNGLVGCILRMRVAIVQNEPILLGCLSEVLELLAVLERGATRHD